MIAAFLEAVDGPLEVLRGSGLFKKAEVRAPGGVPDYVLYRYLHTSVHYVVAIEFKLSNWRKALAQAFRYRNFANEAYVVLDQSRARRALESADMFRKANVGLLTFCPKLTVEVVHYPEPSVPFSAHFSRMVAEELLPMDVDAPDDFPFTRTARGGIALSELRRSLAGIG